MGIVRTSILGRPGRLSAHCSSSVNAAHTLTCEEPSSPTTRRGVVIDQLDGPACLDSPSSVRHLVSVSERHEFLRGVPPGPTESDLHRCHPSDKRDSRPTSSTTSSTVNAGDYWCRVAPDLAAFGSLRAIRVLRGEAEDQALGALLRLAAKDGGDDELAAVAVLHQVGGSVRTIARHFWHVAGGEAEGIVTGAMWEQIRAYDWHGRTRHHAAALHHATRKSVRSVLLRDDSRWQTRGVIPINPQSWLFEVVMEQPDVGVSVSDLGSGDQLEILLSWATGRGVVDEEDAALLEALLEADRRNPTIPKWRRGACSMSAVEQMASERGVCTKSVIRARDRVIAKLREAAPAFLEEVA